MDMEPSARILAVDDEPRNLTLIEGMLTPFGYEVICASNGAEAIEKAVTCDPDVVLLDVMMPVMDGFEVARRLRSDARTRQTPIVMVTALDGVDHRVQALEAGADDFLSKPVSHVELCARVRTLAQVKAYHDHVKSEQGRLEAEVAKRTRDLEKAMRKIETLSMEAIYRLSRAAEYRDDDTGEHIQRMSRYAAAVARQMGLNDNVARTLLYAAPMHDVGKIGIPDRVLLKPGKLDDEEWALMQQHTTIGGRILDGSPAPVVRVARTIALTHHEKWDGAGYPRGLKGKAIPLLGRIATITDVFDALMSKRPYKEPFSLEKTCAIIRKGSGNHFDPEVVEAFFAVMDELLAIQREYQSAADAPFLLRVGTKPAPTPHQ